MCTQNNTALLVFPPINVAILAVVHILQTDLTECLTILTDKNTRLKRALQTKAQSSLHITK